MTNKGMKINSVEELETFMANHPCIARYSLQGKLYIGIVGTKNDIIFIYEKDVPNFMDYVKVAHKYAEEYTATIVNIRRRGAKYLVA